LKAHIPENPIAFFVMVGEFNAAGAVANSVQRRQRQNEEDF